MFASRGLADSGILSLNLQADVTKSADHLSRRLATFYLHLFLSCDAIWRVRGRTVAGPAPMLATPANITAPPYHPDRAEGLEGLEILSLHDGSFSKYLHKCVHSRVFRKLYVWYVTLALKDIADHDSNAEMIPIASRLRFLRVNYEKCVPQPTNDLCVL